MPGITYVVCLYAAVWKACLVDVFFLFLWCADLGRFVCLLVLQLKLNVALPVLIIDSHKDLIITMHDACCKTRLSESALVAATAP